MKANAYDMLNQTRIDELLSAGPHGARELARYAASHGVSMNDLLDMLGEAGWGVGQIDAATFHALIGALRSEYVEPTSDSAADSIGLEILRLICRNEPENISTEPRRLEGVLDKAMGLIADAFDCDAASLFIHDPSQHILLLAATHGLDADLAGNFVIRDGVGITGAAATSRETQVAPVAQEHANYLPYPSHVDSRMTSHMSIPMISTETGRLVGVLNLQNLEFDPFSELDRERAERIARDLALVVQTGRRQSRTDTVLAQRLNDVETLHSITRELTGTLMQDELAQLAARYATELVGASKAAVFRCDEHQNFTSTHSFAAPGAKEVDDDACKAVAKEACMTRVARAQRTEGEEGPLFFAAALVARNELLGVVVARIEPAFAPGPGQLSMFQAFADTVAMGLSNADLYDQSVRSAATSAALLQEMHHRVRNNLQIVASLLSLQARAANDDGVSRPLMEAVARIQSIASIHDLMSQPDVEFASLQTVAETVAGEASINVVPPGLNVTFEIDAAGIQIPSKHAMVLGLLINECITNAIIHGFEGRESGTIRICTTKDDGFVDLAVSDDGAGVVRSDDDRVKTSTGLGTRIATRIAESDLRGSFSIEPASPCGTTARIRFPMPGVAPAGP